MGYSCSATAHETLEKISEMIGSIPGPKNQWKNGDKSYFYEIGKENYDGAITGSIWRIESLYGKRVGSFRIENDGTVTRFPYLTSDIKDKIIKNKKKD